MSMGLFVTGIWAGIALVYVIIHYLSFTNESTLSVMIKSEMDNPSIIEEPITTCTMTLEEMDAWYNSVMEIFSVKE